MTTTIKTEHTPLPWSISRIDLSGTTIVHNRKIITQLDCAEFEREDIANAAIIVRAVNSYEAMKDALEWYREQSRLARLIHSEGDKGRHEIANDGGAKARAALKLAKGE